MSKAMKVPAHIAVIMDGNGRWARGKRLPRIFGHREGANSVRHITEACAKLGVKYLTLYAFSTENWKRPVKEVNFLMKLLCEYLDKEMPTLMKNNVRFNTIGDISKLPAAARQKIAFMKKKTGSNNGLTMTVALNYGSRDEIIRAVKKIASAVKTGRLSACKISEKTINASLDTADMPDPDLLIRTSGEMRISNYLLWQIAYSELYVTPVFWPDFRERGLIKAIKEYNRRERRYGGV